MIARETLTVHGIDLEVLRGGGGGPIVVLHGMHPLTPASDFLTRLGGHGAVIAPSMPGFGDSGRPKDFDTVFDVVHLTRAILDATPGGPITLVGLSFGGWIAAEVAAQGHARLGRLVLADAVGIKIGDPESADIFDIYNRSPAETRAATFHDPDRFGPDFDEMDDSEIIRHARDRDALCLYSWNPYLYNPQLPRWLGRIGVPTLVAWGQSDGIVTPAYGRAYANLIPGARFETIAGAGHCPEIERPEALAALIASFVGG